jgi:hypothetical protein
VNCVRVTAQLIDAGSGAQLWADRFDGGLEDVFELQQQPGQRRALRSVKQREVMLEKNNKTAVLGLPPQGINSSQPISAVKFLCVQKGGKINVKELDVDDLPRHSACAVAAIAGCR